VVKVHVKKCHPEPFAAIGDGSKTFEWRREDDCKFEVGDVLLLLEYNPPPEDPPDILDETVYGYTGETLRRRVTYVLRGRFGVPDGYAVLGLSQRFEWPGSTRGEAPGKRD